MTRWPQLFWKQKWNNMEITLEKLEPPQTDPKNAHNLHKNPATRGTLLNFRGQVDLLSSGTKKAGILWLEADFNSIFQPQQLSPFSQPLYILRLFVSLQLSFESFGYLVLC